MAADARSAADAFVDAMLAGAAVAAERAGGVQRCHFTIGGRSLELSMVGHTIADRFTTALAHARSDGALGGATDDRQLRLSVWDRAASDVLPPPLPWAIDDILPNGTVRNDRSDGLFAHYDRWVRLLTIYDPRRRIGVVHAADARALPSWMERSPFRPILTQWCTDAGDAVLHASTVVIEGRAVALAGPSGAGKSTTMLHCLAAGHGTVGDDACIVQLSTDAHVARPMFGLAKLERDAAPLLDGRGLPRLGDEDGRPVFDLGSALMPAAELHTVAITEVVPGVRTSWREISASAALRGLVDGSIAEGAGVSLAALRRLVSTVRCVRVSLGSDPVGVVSAIEELAA